jgi:hypothetical protein
VQHKAVVIVLTCSFNFLYLLLRMSLIILVNLWLLVYIKCLTE